MDHSSGHPDSARLAAATTVVNAALLGALAVLAFDPQRHAFGRVTGLWRDCMPTGGATCYERWSPLILLVLVPAIAGFVLARQTTGPISTTLKIVSVVLGFLAVVFFLVPTGAAVA